jgi:Uncharacterized protein conserved in bacteria
MADIPASVILVTYTAPLSRIDELLAEHRAWLARQYQAGTFIAAGRQVPRTGGVILSRLGAAETIELAASDPFALAGAATHQVIEFVLSRGPLFDLLNATPQP